jgi:putative transposase
VERFNRTFRQEVLGAYVFESRDQVHKNSAEWMREYDNERPHDTLDGMTLASFRARMTAESSSLIMSL